MATSLRLLPSRAQTIFGALTLMGSLLLTLLLTATPAGAIVTRIEGQTYGVTPRDVELPTAASDPSAFANPEGHVVVHSSNVYAIYWDPSGYEYHGDWQHVIDGFLHNLGSANGALSNVFADDDQYIDRSDQRGPYTMTFRGAFTDTDSYPQHGDCEDPTPGESGAIVCLTDSQIQAELKTFISQHSLPVGMNSIFYVLTPPDVTVCLGKGGENGNCSDYLHASYSSKETKEERLATEKEEMTRLKNSFCSYHNDINPTSSIEGDASTVLYAVIPWIAGGLGDKDLYPRSGDDCQDGGFNPASKPHAEESEAKAKKTVAEEEAFEKMDRTEQIEQEESEELSGVHQEEPNQLPCPTIDGWCDTGLADLIINQIAVEQQNTTTNPLLDSWRNQKNSDEVADECRNLFAYVLGGSATALEFTFAGTLFNQTIGTGIYYLNDAFNLAAEKLGYPGTPCVTGVSVLPQFTAPNTVGTNELVGFDGMESDITMNAGTIYTYYGHPQAYYSTYSWNFGDGTPVVTGQAPGAPTVNSPGVTPCSEAWEAPCAASVYHSYQYGGTYNVTLTVTDVGGNTASITEPITVDGPSAPAPAPTPAPTPSTTPTGGSGSGSSGSAGSGSTGSSSGASGSQTGTASSVPAPVVTAAFASTSLKKVKSAGIPVHYTVNEQVAGSVQVLLETSVAKRLGIKGQLATGLAKGTPSETIIGTAVLVTTKAGNGTVHVKFASKTAERLARSHKLKLTLRLVARNASRTHPATTTTLSTVVFS